MGSKYAPATAPVDPLSARVAELEVQLLEVHMLLNAAIAAIPNLRSFLQNLKGDVEAWGSRKTLAAHTEMAVLARLRLLAHIEGMRSGLDSKSDEPVER